MNVDIPDAFARRDFLKGAGALIVGFTLAGAFHTDAASALELGPYGPPEDQIDSWLAIGEDGRATLFTGCCELGTGSSTGLMQIMAEELDMSFERVRLVGPDTNRTPDQFVSSGSRTIAAHSRPIRIAAAEARAALVELASKRLNVPADQLIAAAGIVRVRNAPARKLSYPALVGRKPFQAKITHKAQPKEHNVSRIH